MSEIKPTIDEIRPTAAPGTDRRPRRAIPMARELFLLVLLILLVIYFAFRSPHFLDVDNLREMASQFSEIGLVALPQTMVILAGGIDLSVGSLMGLCSVGIGAAGIDARWPFAGAAAAGVAVGALGGAVNGVASAWGGMPPLVVTLATLAIYRGLAISLSGERSFTGFPDSSAFIGQGTIAGFPVQFLILAAAVVIAAIVLHRSPFGRYLFATGGNEAACRLAGVPVDRVRFWTYVWSGLATGLATAIHVSRLGTARPDSGVGLELDVISAVVLGGTDVAGGDGGILGTVLGLLILSVLHSGLDMINFEQERQPIVIGALLIGAIAVDRAVRRQRR